MNQLIAYYSQQIIEDLKLNGVESAIQKLINLPTPSFESAMTVTCSVGVFLKQSNGLELYQEFVSRLNQIFGRKLLIEEMINQSIAFISAEET